MSDENKNIKNNIKEFLIHTKDDYNVRKEENDLNLEKSAKYKQPNNNKKESNLYYFPKINKKNNTPPSASSKDVDEFLYR